ncbi:hypothetical protein [Rudanella lutea]|uniref:hypothetical protein n=1 Tax=Rudanella lutea TaxID=451374 RepID=UPI0012FC2AA4|nr:hypothetical protein [Rudanella lutea]
MSELSVVLLCQPFAVSRSAFYRYRRGASYSDIEEEKPLVERGFNVLIHPYGARRIQAELLEQGDNTYEF